MSSCSAHHHHHHQASFVSTQFRGRVGKTSLKNKASCSTSTSSSSSNNSGRAGVRCFAAISKPWDVQKPCKLVLEDGSVWQGKAFGAEGTKIGEVVFNTSLSGYQEILTDPSYAGQFVLFTCPHIGNVGINPLDMESTKVHMGATLVRHEALNVSNYRSTQSLDTYLKDQGVIGISDIDTRAITVRLREKGSLNGVVTTDMSISDDDLLKMSKGYDIVGKDLIGEVCVKEPYKWVDPTGSEWEFAEKAKSNKDKFNVVCFDFGIKNNIMRRLASFGCELTVVPANYSAEDVMKLKPDGILFSNGPGDPSAAPYAVENCKKLLGQVPVFGICMGHQVLGQAFGGKTFKMKFGHHGGNHPVRNEFTQAVEISAQNHNFAVDPNSLPKEVKVSHLNLNDGTCAGMVWEEKMAMTIQYHPEASPGPHDSDNCFAQFVDMIRASKGMAVSR